MLDRAKFTETLESVAEIIRTAPEPMTEEEILGYFADMELTEEQKQLVFTYLTTPHESNGDAQEAEEETNLDDEWNEDEELSDAALAGLAPANAGGFTEEEIRVSPVLQMYLDELSELPTYTEAEEDKLYDRLISGDETVIKTLADCWLARVLELAKKHRGAKATLEDTIQEGNMGLFLQLQELLGSESKADFRSLLADSIEKNMWEFIVESGEVSDEGDSIVGKMSLIQEAKKMLEEQEGRGVTVQELADYTKMPADELQGILSLIEKANRP